MTLLVVYMSWSIANCCPVVNHYRAQGLSDQAIEELARSHRVPEWVIRWAKKNCKAA